MLKYLLALTPLVFLACQKEEGIGGRASITGKVYEYEINRFTGDTLDQFYKADADVYIVFGDDAVYGEDMETHYDGTYQFEYLFKGNYTIYAYSECDSCSNGEKAHTIQIEITDKKQEVVAPDIIIYDYK